MLDNINQIEVDEFNRTSAILAINKPAGMTSHDVVDAVRKKLRTRKVGHAGALDPFATGVLLIMVGKYTKKSMELMRKDKEYSCSILLGIATTTQDPEGKVTKVDVKDIEQDDLFKLEGIKKGYNQRVPLFSSVKVEGQKLRQLAHRAKEYKFAREDKVELLMKDGSIKQVILPRKEVYFSKFEIGGLKSVAIGDLEEKLFTQLKANDIDINTSMTELRLVVACSKGTYIRQLAEDIGNLLGTPAMLHKLERTRVAEITLDQCISIEDIPKLQ